jgi:hypothetical protein
VILFTAVLLPTLAAIILTIVFGAKIPTTREDTYILPTIILGAASFVLFIALVFFTNKLLNDIRIYAKNERLGSSEEGKRLVTIRLYADLYKQLLAPIPTRTKPVEEEDTATEKE